MKQQLSKISAKEMVAIFKNNKPLQAASLKENFIGLYIKTSGKIFQVDDMSNYITFVLEDKDNILICANFDKPYSKELTVLGKNDLLELEGTVFNVSERCVTLDHCVLPSNDKNQISAQTVNNYNNSQVHYGTGDNVGKDKLVYNDSTKRWYEKPLGIILLGLIIAGLVYWFGWN